MASCVWTTGGDRGRLKKSNKLLNSHLRPKKIFDFSVLVHIKDFRAFAFHMSGNTVDLCRRLLAGAILMDFRPFPVRNRLEATAHIPKMLCWAPLGAIYHVILSMRT